MHRWRQRIFVPLLGFFLLHPLLANAGDEEWQNDQYWDQQRAVREKARERNEAHRKAWEEEHEAWRKAQRGYARQKAEEEERELLKKKQAELPEVQQKAPTREAEQWRGDRTHERYSPPQQRYSPPQQTYR